VRKKKSNKSFTKREIAEAINNAVILAKQYSDEGITDRRLARLKNYTAALFEPLLGEIDQGYLAAEEAVFICLAGGLFIQAGKVLGSDKLPAIDLVLE